MMDKRVIVAGVAVVLLLGMVPPAAAQAQHEPAEETDIDDIEQIDEDVWNEAEFQHSTAVTLHSVDVVGDYAVVTMSSTADEEEVVITDGTRETTGELPRYKATLDTGQNAFRIPLVNPDNKAVTVDSDGSAFFWISEGDSLPLNLTPGLLAPIAVLMGLIIAIVTIIGLDLFARLNGGNTEVVR